MLSPGEWHKRIPKDRKKNLKLRRGILREASRDAGFRALMVDRCRNDILWYVNLFCWTYNPRLKVKVVPFITWPFQDLAFLTILDHIERKRDLVIEKSRDMGASWICVTAIEWLWHFEEWTQSLVVSREGELVDGKTPDALFWKIDFLHRWQPDWLMPRWNPRLDRTKRYAENPDTNSTITGQATTEKIGIGGRATVGLLDEFSRVDRGFEVRDGTADTTDCRIFNSTHTGPGTAFHAIATSGATDKIIMHWSEHPEKSRGKYRYNQDKNQVEVLDPTFHFPADFDFVMDGSPAGGPFPGIRSPWYDAECNRRGSKRAIAMDLDIDVTGSVSQFFDALMIATLIAKYALPPFWQGDLSYDHTTGRPEGEAPLIPVDGGPLRLWLPLTARNRPAPGPYAIAADVASGTGATPSCLSVLNCKTGEKVAEYANPHIVPEKFAIFTVALCWLFSDTDGNGARLAWEVPGPGVTFGMKVQELGYGNVYYREANPNLAGGKISDTPGWHANNTSKLSVLEEYRAALHARQFINRSEKALDECRSFKYTTSGFVEHAGEQGIEDPSGARVNHGDRVIPDAIAWKLCKAMGMMAARIKDDKEIKPGSLAWRKQLAGASRSGDGWGK